MAKGKGVAGPAEEPCRIQIVPGVPDASGETSVLISLQTPEGSGRAPCDICCVVDISGSMGAEAVVQTEGGSSEGHGLSVLDIVKHAMKTIIRNLADGDRLALVTYSNDANTVFGLTKMDSSGRSSTEAKLDGLVPEGMTNLWDGLRTGIELLKTGAQVGRLQHIMLFTDGLPNINPPRGILPMVKRLKDKEGGLLPCTVSTFGFGYELDSDLLSELAISGCGSYAFIPDAGFVGTVFVNAMTNLLVTFAKDVALNINPMNGASFTAIPGGHPAVTMGNSLIVGLGSLQFGQSKDVVVKMRLPPSGEEFFQATLAYTTRMGAPIQVAASGAGQGSNDSKGRVDAHFCRLTSVDSIRDAMRCAKLTNIQKAQGVQIPLPQAQQVVNGCCSSIDAMVDASDASVQALLEDLRGQVMEALSKEEWYDKWGVHYLPSLVCAHLSQQCNNFKDPGVQAYGGSLFANLRDEADDIFCSLPPPRPTARPAPAPAPAAANYNYVPMQAGMFAGPGPRVAPVSMAAYYDRYAGCIDGECLVELATGGRRRVADVSRGDFLAEPGGGRARVVCVVRTWAPGGRFLLVDLAGGALRITPHHPVKIGQAWLFPSEVALAKERPCRAVYTFVLEEEAAGAVIVAGVPCVSLGHGIAEGAAAHAFFGSRRSVEDLSGFPGFNNGLVDLLEGSVVRDDKTGLVSKFVSVRLRNASRGEA